MSNCPLKHSSRRIGGSGLVKNTRNARPETRPRATACVGQAGCLPHAAVYFAAPTETDTVATFSSFAFVNVAVWRMSSEDAPIFTV